MTTTNNVLAEKAIAFYLNDNEYAVPVEYVTAIEKVHHITRIPKIASYIKGVINLRGVIIPIIDLKKRFGLGDCEITNQTRILIVSYKETEVGFIVDAANDVLDIPDAAVEAQPEIVGEVALEFIKGVAKFDKKLIVLLDLEQILEIKSGKEN